MALKRSTKKFILSDESTNSYSIKVLTAGIRTEEFLKNPVGLLNHNYDKVICLWSDINIEGKSLTGVPLFDGNDAEALKICQKVDDDIIKGCSIGITALAWDGNIITDCILKEISITPLPSNKNAVVLYSKNNVQLSYDQWNNEHSPSTTTNYKNYQNLIDKSPKNLDKPKLSDLLKNLDFLKTGAESVINDLYISMADISRGIERDNYGTVAGKNVDDVIKLLPALKNLKEQEIVLREVLEKLNK